MTRRNVWLTFNEKKVLPAVFVLYFFFSLQFVPFQNVSGEYFYTKSKCTTMSSMMAQYSIGENVIYENRLKSIYQQ